MKRLFPLFAAFSWLTPTVVLAQSVPARNQPPNVPDLSGPWQIIDSKHEIRDIDGNLPPMTPQALETYQRHLAARAAGDVDFDTMAQCVPPGVPRIMTIERPFRIVQGQNHYLMLFNWNHAVRVVYLGRDHFEGIGSQYLGQSVGRWDGDTFVVHSNAFKDVTVLDDAGVPHSEDFEVTERYTLSQDGATMRVDIEFRDPRVFTRPWATRLAFERLPATTIIEEDYCLKRLGIDSLDPDKRP